MMWAFAPGSGIDLMRMGQEDTPSILSYLETNLKPGETVGFDGLGRDDERRQAFPLHFSPQCREPLGCFTLDDLFYYLSDPGLFHYLLESVLMVIPICTLWNQFKHMRLERTYKSINLFFFLCKMAVICAILIGGGVSCPVVALESPVAGGAGEGVLDNEQLGRRLADSSSRPGSRVASTA